MGRPVVALLPLMLISSAGCTPTRLTEQECRCTAERGAPIDEATRSWAIEIADRRAQEVLDSWNARAEAKQFGGPFALDQYSRNAYRMLDGDAAGMAEPMVIYCLEVPVSFRGHPQHFAILVNQADGSTRVHYGR